MNAAFIEKFMKPWNDHDVDGAMALMTDDCLWEIPKGSAPHGTRFEGAATVRSAIASAFKAMPDIRYELVRSSFGRDLVVLELLGMAGSPLSGRIEKWWSRAMAEQIFAAINTRGPNWNDDKAMEEQGDWRAHADYMNALVDDGFMLLGGPLVGTRDVLLIVRATDEAEVDSRLDNDIWVRTGLLTRRQINPWWLRLGSL